MHLYFGLKNRATAISAQKLLQITKASGKL